MSIALLCLPQRTLRFSAQGSHKLRDMAVMAAATAALVTCASNSQGDRPQSAFSAIEARGSGELVIVSSQLGMAGPGLSLYDALRRLRPELVQWSYRYDGVVDAQLPVVFIDGMRVGDVDVLRRIPALRARKVVFVPADAAFRRYGAPTRGGAILVTSFSDGR